MRKSVLLLSFVLLSIMANAQENNTYKVIAGARINPLVLYDFDGNRKEAVRLHGELGVLLQKKWYFSVGYTPFMNSYFTFNEYWFTGLDKKVPVSVVASAEWMPDNNRVILQGGPNIKLSGGNVFAFLFTPTGKLDLGLKIGAFIPLNTIIKQNQNGQ